MLIRDTFFNNFKRETLASTIHKKDSLKRPLTDIFSTCVMVSCWYTLAAIAYVSIAISRIVVVDIAVFTIATAVGEADICLPFIIAKKLLLRISA